METPNLARNNYHEPDDFQIIREELFGKPPPVLARFYIGAERMPISTKDCPIYEDREYVFLQVKGDRDSQSALATDEHKQQYPHEWNLFLHSMANRGIPLTALPEMRPCIMEALKELGIRCVEDVIAKPLPEYLQKYKAYAERIKAVHTGEQPKKRGRPRKNP